MYTRIDETSMIGSRVRNHELLIVRALSFLASTGYALHVQGTDIVTVDLSRNFTEVIRFGSTIS